MTILYLVLIFLFSIGQIGRISFLGQQINGYYYEIAAGILLTGLIFKYSLKPLSVKFSEFKNIFIFLTILAVTLIISLWKYSVTENMVASLYFFRLTFYLILLIYLEYWNKTDAQVKWNVFILILFGLIAVTSLTQYIFYKDLRNLLYLGWDPHYYRLFGVFLDTAVAAALYGATFIYLFLNKNLFKHYSKLRYLLLTLFFIFGLFTLSRSFYIAFFLSLLFILIRQKKLWMLMWLIGAFVIIIYIIPKPSGAGVDLLRIFSINSRLVSYQEAVKVWQSSPVTGVGYNHIRYVRRDLGFIESREFENTHSGASFHSSFLIVLATSGILGLSGFIAALYALAKKNETTSVLIILLSCLSLTDNIILHPFVLFYFILLYCSSR